MKLYTLVVESEELVYVEVSNSETKIKKRRKEVLDTQLLQGDGSSILTTILPGLTISKNTGSILKIAELVNYIHCCGYDALFDKFEQAGYDIEKVEFS